MPIVSVDPGRPDPGAIARAAELLRQGELVAFPTETVYGLGANALDAAAVRRIFVAKGRPSYDPIIVHVRDVDAARRLVRVWPDAATQLATAFWPGPLTLVLPKRPAVPDVVTAGLDTVAVRVPAHPIARALLEAAGLPVAAPSANRFSELSPTQAEHVARSLGDRVSLIIDGGPTSVGIESTVVRIDEAGVALLRPGIISSEQLAEVVGPLAAAPGAPSGTAARRAPGMLERHYAPRATLELFRRSESARAAARAAEVGAAGGTVGALLLQPLPGPVRHPIMMPDDAAAYARDMYAALHALDEAGCSVVLAERVPDGAAWEGVRDRLRRASTRGSQAGSG